MTFETLAKVLDMPDCAAACLATSATFSIARLPVSRISRISSRLTSLTISSS